jgi:hypothetical protein
MNAACQALPRHNQISVFMSGFSYHFSMMKRSRLGRQAFDGMKLFLQDGVHRRFSLRQWMDMLRRSVDPARNPAAIGK